MLLTGTIEVETSFLLLSSNNFSSLGGRVESLSEPWELKKVSSLSTVFSGLKKCV